LDAAIISALGGIEYGAEFVPFSKSRFAAEPRPCLNWRVTLKRGSTSLTTDYMQGSGHIPKTFLATAGYSPSTIAGAERIRFICETGRTPYGPRLAPPLLRDVLHALLMDLSALDSPTFEEWAADAGYDTDSRKAEAIYRECVALALKLRAMLGDVALAQLREAFQDY